MLIPLVKVNITAEKNVRNHILDLLQEKGILEISEIKDTINSSDATTKGDEVESANYYANQVKASVSFLSIYDKSPKTLKNKLESAFNPQQITLSREELKKIVSTFDYKATIKTVLDIQKNINLNENVITESQKSLNELYGWRNIGFAPRDVNILRKSAILLGSVPSSVFFQKNISKSVEQSSLYKKLEEKTDGLFSIETLNDNEQEVKIIVTFIKECEKNAREILTNFNFKEAEIPYPDRKPADSISYLSKKIQESEGILVELRNKAEDFGSHNLKNLCIAYDYLVWQSEQEENAKKIATTHYLFSLDGWIEEKNIKPLERALSEITPHFAITQLKIDIRETQPVIIKNKLFEPYEAVTDIYGLPRPNEPDPTPFLAPFFTVFFALALTDAGYGFMLVGLCWILMKALKIPRHKQKLFRLLIYAGTVTIIFGGLFGGWFGVVPADLPDSFGSIKEILIKIQVIDPVAEPIKVMLLAFVLGIIQIWFGILVGAWWNFKRNKVKEAILDYGVWNYFLAAIMFWIMVKIGFFAEFSSFATYALLVGAGIIILTQGRKSKNVVLKFGLGVLGLYRLVNYLSDILSYSRLLALGLATGIIAMTINLVATIFKDMAPFGWMGWIIAILILIGGHIFNLAISALGAFIHSGRLQFVEFFPKFMEGGGRRFKPFTRVNNYIKIVD